MTIAIDDCVYIVAMCVMYIQNPPALEEVECFLWTEAQCMANFSTFQSDMWDLYRIMSEWERAKCDPVYKPMAELRYKHEYVKWAGRCWVNLGIAKNKGRNEEARYKALLELWIMLGPEDYNARRLPPVLQRNKFGPIWPWD